MRLFNTDLKIYIHGFVPTKSSPGWQELTVPIAQLEKRGVFDPKFVASFAIYYGGVDRSSSTLTTS